MKKTEKQVVETPVTVETQVKQLGRPADPTSKRQVLIKEREERRQSGALKKGRPVVETSKRQELLKVRAVKIEAEGSLKKGRPVIGTSKRQELLKARAEKVAAGISLKKGRPKVTTTLAEVPVTDLVEIERVKVEAPE